MKFSRKYLIFFVLNVLIIFIDQLTKNWIVENLQLGESQSMIRDYLNLTYVRNHGAAFGLLSGAPASFRVPFFLIVPSLALIGITWAFKKAPVSHLKTIFALSLVIAGACGNLIDRIFLGYVVDFLNFHWKGVFHTPIFNLADVAICTGTAMLCIGTNKKEEEIF